MARRDHGRGQRTSERCAKGGHRPTAIDTLDGRNHKPVLRALTIRYGAALSDSGKAPLPVQAGAQSASGQQSGFWLSIPSRTFHLIYSGAKLQTRVKLPSLSLCLLVRARACWLPSHCGCSQRRPSQRLLCPLGETTESFMRPAQDTGVILVLSVYSTRLPCGSGDESPKSEGIATSHPDGDFLEPPLNHTQGSGPSFRCLSSLKLHLSPPQTGRSTGT
jgi:hypothetical protein